MSSVISAVTPEMTVLLRDTSMWSNRFAILTIGSAILMLVATPLAADAFLPSGFEVVLYVASGVALFAAGYILHRFSVKLKETADAQAPAALIQALKLEHLYWQISVTLTVLMLLVSVAAVAVPALRGTLSRSAEARAARDVEATRAALEAYALAHHQYPAALAQLVPTHIAALPERPLDYKAECENRRCFAYTLKAGQ
jgi:hypothetical protein